MKQQLSRKAGLQLSAEDSGNRHTTRQTSTSTFTLLVLTGLGGASSREEESFPKSHEAWAKEYWAVVDGVGTGRDQENTNVHTNVRQKTAAILKDVFVVPPQPVSVAVVVVHEQQAAVGEQVNQQRSSGQQENQEQPSQSPPSSPRDPLQLEGKLQSGEVEVGDDHDDDQTADEPSCRIRTKQGRERHSNRWTTWSPTSKWNNGNKVVDKTVDNHRPSSFSNGRFIRLSRKWTRRLLRRRRHRRRRSSSSSPVRGPVSPSAHGHHHSTWPS
jgi:hypothetical protein